jgi:hypothetical protein
MLVENFKLPLVAWEKASRAIGAAILLGCLQSQAWAVQSVTLGWWPSTDPLATGYKLYYGGTSARYTNLVDVGNHTTATVTGLVEGRTYYFAATAYNLLGLESLPSNEISFTVPLPTPAPVPGCKLVARQIPAPAGTVLSITSTNAPSSWVLEASTDLVTWGAISFGANPLVNAVVAPSQARNRFFRLKSDLSGVSLAARKIASNGFSGSFYLTTAGPAPSSWTVETSVDLKSWSVLATGANTPVNVAVIPSPAPAMFFRLKKK